MNTYDTVLLIVGMGVAMAVSYYIVTAIGFFNDNFKDGE